KADYLEKIYDVKNDLSIQSFIHQEEIFSIQEKPTPTDLFKDKLFQSIQIALKGAKEKRKSEGDFLLKDVVYRVEQMENMLQLMQARTSVISEAYRSRIKDRIEKYVGEEISVSESNILQEVA